jgi:Fe-Mn family superoxide dismutase
MSDQIERRGFIQGATVLAGVAAASASLTDHRAFAQTGANMTYDPKPMSFDPKAIKGISEKVLVSHYENNYVGAVKRLNAIGAQLADLDFGKAPNFVINGLKREELIAANSMILHEIYFDGLVGAPVRAERWPKRSRATSEALSAGTRNSPQWERRRAEGRVG